MANLYQEQASLEALNKDAQKLLSKQRKSDKKRSTAQNHRNTSAQRKGPK
jgi:hypothetical protein